MSEGAGGVGPKPPDSTPHVTKAAAPWKSIALGVTTLALVAIGLAAQFHGISLAGIPIHGLGTIPASVAFYAVGATVIGGGLIYSVIRRCKASSAAAGATSQPEETVRHTRTLPPIEVGENEKIIDIDRALLSQETGEVIGYTLTVSVTFQEASTGKTRTEIQQRQAIYDPESQTYEHTIIRTPEYSRRRDTLLQELDREARASRLPTGPVKQEEEYAGLTEEQRERLILEHKARAEGREKPTRRQQIPSKNPPTLLASDFYSEIGDQAVTVSALNIGKTIERDIRKLFREILDPKNVNAELFDILKDIPNASTAFRYAGKLHVLGRFTVMLPSEGPILDLKARKNSLAMELEPQEGVTQMVVLSTQEFWEQIDLSDPNVRPKPDESKEDYATRLTTLMKQPLDEHCIIVLEV